MPAVGLLVADGHQNPCRFPRFQDRYHLIRFRPAEVGGHKVVSFLFLGRLQDRRSPSPRAVRNKVVILAGDAPQHIAAHRIGVAIGPEEAHHPLLLLKGLNDAVQQEAVEAAVVETDAILVVFVEGVHDQLLGCGYHRA
jgi:hypothetical protein